MTLLSVSIIDVAPFLAGGTADKQAVANEIGHGWEAIAIPTLYATAAIG